MTDGTLRGAVALAPVDAVLDSEALARELPAFLTRARQLIRLAEIAATGPDPEALLPDIAELERCCAAFLRAHA